MIDFIFRGGFMMICTTRVTLKTLTPLCSHGFYQQKPEFRISELKSMMRFWWRAINTFDDLKIMKKKEGGLFGSTTLKSPLQIRLDVHGENTMNTAGKESWVNRTSGICPEKNISLIFTYYGDKFNQDLMNYYINLLKVSLILGGLGKRSRRGGGALKLVGIDKKECDQKDIFVLLKKAFLQLEIHDDYDFQDNRITRTNSSKLIDEKSYPFLKKIIIGSKGLNLGDFKQKIRNAMKKTSNLTYHKNGQRMACPVYLSAYEHSDEHSDLLVPIVSILNNTDKSEAYDKYKKIIINEVIKCRE